MRVVLFMACLSGCTGTQTNGDDAADDAPTDDVSDDVPTDDSDEEPGLDEFYADEPALIPPDELLAEFYAQHPREALPKLVVDVVESFVTIENAVFNEEYVAAKTELDAVKAVLPWSDPAWFAEPSDVDGINVGNPVGYYGLRMLEEIIDWRLVNDASDAEPVTLTVVAVGCSEGTQARTRADLEAGVGTPTTKSLEPAILADDSRIVHQASRIFRRYVEAMSQGTLRMKTQVVSLPSLCMEVNTTLNGGSAFASPGIHNYWDALDAEVIAQTDWWMFIYPSMVPAEFPDFETAEFITGGMGLGPNGGPAFIADDRWLTTKPPHLGVGEYTELERRMYQPQWQMHEFYHHLFRTWPEFGLEASSHQWFDRSTWPDDFVGAWEPDYYIEAQDKRLRDASPKMSVALRYQAPPAGSWDALTYASLAGRYERVPVENDWHAVTVTSEGSSAQWTNDAGASWSLVGTPSEGFLRTGPECPYGEVDVALELERRADGSFGESLLGLRFGGEVYERR